MKRIITSAAISCLLIASGTAHAGWWDKAKEVLGSETGVQILQSVNKQESVADNLSHSDMSAGLREALRISSEHVVAQLGTENGFNLDPNIHIPLPNALQRVNTALAAIGLNTLTENLERRLNRAAEIATPKAKELFLTAIKEMTIKDAKQILTGPDDAATQYLRSAMGADLEKEMQPIIQQSLAKSGTIQAYDQVVGRYSQLPFAPDVKADLQSYVATKSMDGIFFYIAQEEASIRKNPAKRTTDLLKKVFSGQ